jgi:hypothetical protein
MHRNNISLLIGCLAAPIALASCGQGAPAVLPDGPAIELSKARSANYQMMCSNFTPEQCTAIYDTINYYLSIDGEGEGGECAWAAEYTLGAMQTGHLTYDPDMPLDQFGAATGAQPDATIRFGPHTFDPGFLDQGVTHEGSHNGGMGEGTNSMDGQAAYGVGDRCAGFVPV